MSIPPRHLAIIAGEASGDTHAVALMRSLRERHPGIRFTGKGGPKMEAEALAGSSGGSLDNWIAEAGVLGGDHGIDEVWRDFVNRTPFVPDPFTFDQSLNHEDRDRRRNDLVDQHLHDGREDENGEGHRKNPAQAPSRFHFGFDHPREVPFKFYVA